MDHFYGATVFVLKLERLHLLHLLLNFSYCFPSKKEHHTGLKCAEGEMMI